ncbi:hypothetical protein H5079_05370 [Pseudoalteromonas sp. SG44-5]|uniref:COG4648 family protein n=1 Tax=Pseudoalteromonas sp. SG44-5 TaxID=2760960 RepID=UPI0015F94512|nr:hypothetical protein [Pseudoalteromonas sp. SG44-5]MBB1405042.1 hypothetical protein [Pseudoalteromonas sp. SG44-5]
MLKALLTTLIMLCLACYPVIVYVGLTQFNSQLVAIVLLFLLALRLWLSKALFDKMPWLKPATFLAVIAIVLSKVFDSDVGLRLYPVIINTVMLLVFSYSLYKGPSIIETFARITEPELDEQGVQYTKKVTQLWCVFFIVNGGIALYTSLFSSLAVWAFYNGVIAYVAMGVLFALEWLVRLKVKRKARV